MCGSTTGRPGFKVISARSRNAQACNIEVIESRRGAFTARIRYIERAQSDRLRGVEHRDADDDPETVPHLGSGYPGNWVETTQSDN